MTAVIVVVAIILACIAVGAKPDGCRTYKDNDYPYMTKDGWKHTYSEEDNFGNERYTEHRSYHRDDPWQD